MLKGSNLLKCSVIGISTLGRWNGVLYLIAWHAWRAPPTMKHEGLQVGSSRCVFSMVTTIIWSPFSFVSLWLPMLLRDLDDDDDQIPLRWIDDTFTHWYQRLHPWKVFHYAQIPTTKQFVIMFVCQLWKVSLLFCLSLARKKTFSWYSKVHICTFMWSLGWCF